MHTDFSSHIYIERECVQKVAFSIILSENYESYDKTLEITGLTTLEKSRIILCQKFASKCLKNAKACQMFPLTVEKKA